MLRRQVRIRVCHGDIGMADHLLNFFQVSREVYNYDNNAKSTGDSVQIKVSDTCKGIDPKVLKMVFNSFSATKSKGNCLGLAIYRRLIEQHNGSINFLNNQEGGVTFVITLPVKQESEEQAT